MGLQEELAIDMQRLWQRNLGRDDRLIADTSRYQNPIMHSCWKEDVLSCFASHAAICKCYVLFIQCSITLQAFEHACLLQPPRFKLQSLAWWSDCMIVQRLQGS